MGIRFNAGSIEMNFLGALIGTILFPIGFMMIIYTLFELLDEKQKLTALLEKLADRD
jgi:formate/nitrite transporter FocA (FNT family)